MSHNYTKQLLVIYLKFKLNWACCFVFVLDFSCSVKSGNSKLGELTVTQWNSPWMMLKWEPHPWCRSVLSNTVATAMCGF